MGTGCGPGHLGPDEGLTLATCPRAVGKGQEGTLRRGHSEGLAWGGPPRSQTSLPCPPQRSGRCLPQGPESHLLSPHPVRAWGQTQGCLGVPWAHPPATLWPLIFPAAPRSPPPPSGGDIGEAWPAGPSQVHSLCCGTSGSEPGTGGGPRAGGAGALSARSPRASSGDGRASSRTLARSERRQRPRGPPPRSPGTPWRPQCSRRRTERPRST